MSWVVIHEEPSKSAPQRQNQPTKSKEHSHSVKTKRTMSEDQEPPTQLPNGKWACNHKCKDKTR